MNSTIDDQELLLRAVYPANMRPNFWVKGRLSSAALKDKRGLSVDRTGGRPLEASVIRMQQNFQGTIISISMQACNTVQAYVKYCPSKTNPYHSEIHGSTSEVELSDFQALSLARQAKLEYSQRG